MHRRKTLYRNPDSYDTPAAKQTAYRQATQRGISIPLGGTAPPAEPDSTASSRRVRSWTELLLLVDFRSKSLRPADASTRSHCRTKRGEKILRLARESNIP